MDPIAQFLTTVLYHGPWSSCSTVISKSYHKKQWHIRYVLSEPPMNPKWLPFGNYANLLLPTPSCTFKQGALPPLITMKDLIPLWWSLSWCFFSSLMGRWDCPPRALDKARRPALLPIGGMAGGCNPEGCGVRGTGRPWPCDKCWAWSCCCCEKSNTDIEFVLRKLCFKHG